LRSSRAQLARADGIKTDRRFVEEQDARPVEERSREVQALLHPARVALDALVRSIGQAHESEQLADPCADLARSDAIQLCEIPEVVRS